MRRYYIAIILAGVSVLLAVQKPHRSTIIQEAPPAPRDSTGSGGTIFIGGGVFFEGSQPAGGRPARMRREPARPPRSGWEFPDSVPGWELFRRLFVPDVPVCDTTQRGLNFGRSEPFIARYPVASDSSTAPDTAAPPKSIHLCVPRDVALGPGGDLYVLDGNLRSPYDSAGAPARGLVRVYPSGATRGDAPERMFFIYDAVDISVDSSGHLWASGRDPGGLIRVYDPDARGEAEPVRVIAGAGVDPGRLMGFGVDGRGNSYVATDDTVVVYPPGARDGDPPIRKIAGPDTFLRRARDLAIGPGDTLFVLNAFGYWKCGSSAPREVTVSVYAPGADGNVEPVRLLVITQEGKTAGSGFALMRPQRLAVDDEGSVYVSFDQPSWIAVFRPGAKGVVSPNRILRMDKTGADPRGLAVGKDGAVYVVATPSLVLCL